MSLPTKILLSLAFLTLLPIGAWSATVHVSTGGNNTTGTGSVSAPFATIQKAIDTATIYDTILVAPGTYSGAGNQEIDFKGKSLRLVSEAGPLQTLIDAGQKRIALLKNGEGPDTLIKGFTFFNAYRNEGGDWARATLFEMVNSSPTIQDCIFRDNRAEGTFRSGTSGASLLGSWGGRAKLINCLIYNNTVKSGDNASSSDLIHGGFELVENCTIANNTIDAMMTNWWYFIQKSNLRVFALDSTTAVRNTIVWNNAISTIGPRNEISPATQPPTNPTLSYSIFQGSLTGTGVINQDPQFRNAPAADYALASGSPAINTGDPASALDNDGSRADMGHLQSVKNYLMAKIKGGTLPAGSILAGQIVEDFELAKFETTWAEWKQVREWAVINGYEIGNNNQEGWSDHHPVRMVNWYDAVKFCNAKSEMAGYNPAYYYNNQIFKIGEFGKYGSANVTWNPTADGYRLPTEAEWEWGARGGLSSSNFIYSGGNTISQVAWYYSNSPNIIKKVGLKLPNELGLFDMSGNISEWCWDPMWENTRKSRGGNVYNPEKWCKVSEYSHAEPDNWNGVRLARIIETSSKNAKYLLNPIGGMTLFNDTVGYEFKVRSKSLKIKKIGVYDSMNDGLTHSNTVGIWDSQGALVTKVTIPNGKTASQENGYRWVDFTNPIILSANATYRIGAQGGEYCHNGIIAPDRVAHEIDLIGAVRNNNQFIFSYPNASPISGQAIVGPNLSFSTIEPSGPEIVSSPVASPILIGQTLSNSMLSGGVASVNGTAVEGLFGFENPDQQPLLGNSTHSVVFTPSDLGNFTTATTNVTVRVLDPIGDEDGDGLSNSKELEIGTSIFAEDTDGDGLSDGWECGVGRYELVRVPLNWTDSRDHAISRGGHLATITSLQEYNQIKAVLGPNLGENSSWWIGASDVVAEGEWGWVTGETWSYTAWAQGEPNNGLLSNGNEDFAHIRNFDFMTWNDAADEVSSGYTVGYLLEFGYPTDPLNPDTDVDGVTDFREQKDGTDPNKAASFESFSIGLVAYYPLHGSYANEAGFGGNAIPKQTVDFVQDNEMGSVVKITGSGFIGENGGSIEIPAPILEQDDLFTVSFFIKEHGMSHFHGEAYFTTGTGAGSRYLLAHFGNESGETFFNTSKGIEDNLTRSIDSQIRADSYNLADIWNFYTIVEKDGITRIYRNGNEIYSANNTGSPRGNWHLGRHWWGGGANESTRLIASVAKLRIYNRALSSAEVLQLYSKESQNPNIPIWYVATNGSDATGTGSKDLPLATIQIAVDMATNGGAVVVLPGNYTGLGNRAINLRGKSIVVTSLNGPDSTILDLGRSQAFLAHSNETINTVVNGFTVSNGYVQSSADWDGDSIVSIRGNASLTVSNCVFKNNETKANYVTTGMSIINGRNSSVVDNCLFINNTVGGGGWTQFAGGSGTVVSGGNTTRCTIVNNTIYSSVASWSGYNGGIRVALAGGMLRDNLVWGNSPSFWPSWPGYPNTTAQTHAGSSDIPASYSLSADGVSGFQITNTILTNAPIFVSPDSGNFALATGSPGVDAADPMSPLDLDGSRADMGYRADRFVSLISPVRTDTAPPVITLNGNNPHEVFKGSEYTDPGAVVTDDVDAPQTVIGTGTVNTSVLGDYTITYQSSDSAGNAAEPVTRLVKVILDPSGDEDGDGLTNAEELEIGTNPLEKDSDGDGVTDYREREDGTDANDLNAFKTLSKGLLAYYPFNGDASDESGNGMHASIVGAESSPDRNGVINSAYSFNGSGDYMELPSTRFLDGSKSLTIAAWYRFQGSKSGQIFSSGDERGGYDPISMRIGVYGFEDFSVSDTTNYRVLRAASGLDYKNEEWRHIALVLDEIDEATSRLTVYQDGKLVSSANISPQLTVRYDSDMISQIGAIHSDQFWMGQLDDFRFYDRAFTDIEVSQLYSTETASSRYSVILGNFTWDEAKADAESRGGHLATFGSESEWNEAKALFPSSGEFWLGATDAENEGDWKWIDGTPWTFSKWSLSNPDNAANQDVLDTSKSESDFEWLWDDDWRGDYIWGTRRLPGYILEIESLDEMVSVQGGVLPSTSELAGQVVEDFQIGRFEVTWGEWKKVRAWAADNGYDLSNIGEGSGDAHPVRNVNWYDVTKWCNAKSEMEGLQPVYFLGNTTYRSGESLATNNYQLNGYRLPKETEWEWAARGGAFSAGFEYSGSNDANSVAWHYNNSSSASIDLNAGRGTWSVGLKGANELGIHDMTGNVWEWCWNAEQSWETYGFKTNPDIRGGGWDSDLYELNIANRLSGYVDLEILSIRESILGFRLACNAANSFDIYKPSITLNGYNPFNIYLGIAFVDPGAILTDNLDAPQTITGTGTVNTSVLGEYTITYQASDSAGNAAEPVTRTVNVILDPSADEDGDGSSNAIEVHYKSNPNDISETPNSIRPVGFVKQWTSPTASDQTPVPESLNNVIQVAAGAAGYALKSDGTISTWGGMWNGNNSPNIPAYVPEGLMNVVQIDAGINYAAALKGDGTVESWGHFWNGYYHEPTFVPNNLAGIIQISAGISHTAALKADGTVEVWGTNFWGQLNVPNGLKDVVQVEAGGYHTVALKKDGSVVAWGGSGYPPADVPKDLSGVLKIAAGGHHNLALKNDGSIVAWGENNAGQVSVPDNLSRVFYINASHSLASFAVTDNGTVVGWGDQITLPAFYSNILAVDAGWDRNLVLISDFESDNIDSDGDGLTDQWELGIGRYQIVQGSFTWEQARADAASLGGHLATITSESEWQSIKTLTPLSSTTGTIWLGGTDVGQEGNWRWITDEIWSHSRWGRGEPNDYFGYQSENALEIGSSVSDWKWNDLPGNSSSYRGSYILEFGYPTDPNNADTDGDGFNDKEETDAGTDPNNPESFPSAGDPPGGKPSGLLFTDVTSFATTLPEHSLHGVLDYDNDGQDDLLVSTGGITRLWRFQGPLEFEDRTAEAGLEGVVPALLADLNNDGLTDILEVSADRSSAAVYVNNGASAFVKTSLPAVVAGDLKNYRDIQTADIDGDGDLDILYAVNPSFGGGAVAALLNTTGRAAGAPVSFGSKTYLVRTSWNYAKFDTTDANGDGKTDLVILQTNGNWPNDTHPNHPASLYLNTGSSAADYMNADGSRTLAGFSEKENCGITSGNEMSRFTSWDLDNDGDLDLINGSSDWPWVSRPHIYINDGKGQYTQQDSPVFQSTNYYHHGVHLFDADLDNDLDAVWTSLHNFANIYPRMWENKGEAGFSDSTSTWGVTASIPGSGNLGSAGYVADLDGDGDQDLVVQGWNGWGSEKYYRVYRNDADIRGRNWLKIELVGEVSPAQGRGARVEVTAGNKTLTQYIGNDIGGVATTALHFGLGSATKADLVRVLWPSGAVSELTDVAHRQLLQIIESAAIDDVVPPQITLNPAPANNARISETQVNFAGSVSDNRGVQSFEYRINGGSWMPVPEANLSESFDWTLEAALGMGANVFEFRATDSVGNESAVVSRTIFHTPDSDGDGALDYREIADGTDPQDASSINALSKDLVAYYPFTGTFADLTGSSPDALPKNEVQFVQDPEFGDAVKITGHANAESDSYGNESWLPEQFGGYLEIPKPNLQSAGNFTTSLWVKEHGIEVISYNTIMPYPLPPPPEPYYSASYLTAGNGAKSWRLLARKNASGWYDEMVASFTGLAGDNGGFTGEVLGSSIITERWNHYTVRVQDGTLTVFLNGVELYSGPASAVPEGNWFLGRHWWNGGQFDSTNLIATFQNLRIYNRALSESEIVNLYARESGIAPMVDVTGGVLPETSPLGSASVADFQIGKFEVTWGEWKRVRDWAASRGYNFAAGVDGVSDRHPVRNVSWLNAVTWCNAKSEMEGFVPVYQLEGSIYRSGQGMPTINPAANGYRLPTETEWEWAARGGVFSNGFAYSGSNEPHEVAWFIENIAISGNKPVGVKNPNELGLHDMSGNVWEFIWDSTSPSESYRLPRGGMWNSPRSSITVDYRILNHPDYNEIWNWGFRLARTFITDTNAPVIGWDEQSVDGEIAVDASFVYGGTVSEENGLPILEYRSAGSSAWTQIELGGSASPFAWSLPVTLPLGSSTFEFRARDAMGNQSPVATRTISYQPLPEYLVTVTSTPGGSVSPATAGISYRQGTQLQLGATPSEGYRFVRWAGNFSETNSVLSISVSSNLTLQAIFTKSEPPDASPEQSFTGGSSLGVGGSGAAVAGATDTAASPDGGFVSVGDFSGSFAFAGSALISEGSRDGFLVRHSPYGTPEWAVSFGAAGSQVKPARIDIAPDGTIYVGGTCTGTVDFGTGSVASNGGADLFVASFDMNGAIRWVATGGGSANESLGALIVGPQGDVFVTGAMPDNGGTFGDLQVPAGSGSANYEVVLARLGSNGSWQWVNLTGGAGSDSGTALANGPQGTLWWGGTYLGSMEIGGSQLVSKGGKDIFVALVNTDTGEVSNAMSHGGRGADQLNSLLADGDGGFYAAGSQAAGLSLGDLELADSGSTDGFVARYQTPIGWTWAQSLGGDEEDMAVSLASDDEGRIYAAGYFKSSSLQAGQHSATNSFGITADGFLARFDGSGEVKWIRGFGGENNEYTRGLTHSTLGGLHVVGYAESGFAVGEFEIPAPSGFSDAFFVRLNGASSQAPRSISVTASAGGGVEVSPDAPVLPIGTPVVLEAIAQEGFAFEGWSGDAEGQINPLSIILDRNISIHATFVDAAPPVIRIDTPNTGNPPLQKKTDFAGQITDNTDVAEAVWFLNGEEQGPLALDEEGNFRVRNVALQSGENHFEVEAVDSVGNNATREVLLDWNAVRAFHTEETLKVNDGQKINVQLRLESPGDVGGFSVRFHFDSEVFTDPGFSFSGQAMQAGGSVTIGGNFVQVLYSGTGSTINSGTFLVGELNLRARSLPAGQTIDSIVNLEVLETSDGNGNQHAHPTEGSSTLITVTARGKKADANGNGQIDTGDAAVIQALINTPSKKRPWDADLNDLNGSGGIDSGDLTKILRIVAGLDQPPEDLPTPATQPAFAPMAMATSATTSGSAGPNAYFLEEAAKVPLQINVTGTLDDSFITAVAVLPPMGDTLYALQFKLQFPAQLLEIDRWEIGGASPTNSQPLVFSTGPGVLSYATFDSSPWAVDGGTVLRVLFKPKNISASVQRQLLTLSGLKAFGEGGFELLATYQRPGQLTREPTTWLRQAYGELADPDADDDGDGLTNRQEYSAGTDPRSAASKLQLEDFAHDPVQNMQSLRWKAVRGVRYRVLTSDDLKIWSPVGGTEVIGSDTDVEFEIKPDSKKVKSFFRIEAVR